MRSRAILLVVAILLVAGFAALNWAEIVRPSPLLFGPVVMDAPLGAILLGLLALAVLVFVLAAGTMRTQALVESRHHYKTLEAQRELADKAEASRFTDLRSHLDTQLRELRERDTIAATELQRAVVENQRELRTQLEQINRTIAARLTELEHRIDHRLGNHPTSWGGPATAVAAPRHEHAHATAPVIHERGQTEQLREAQMREAQLHEQRVRQEQARANQHDLDERMQQERVREDLRREERAAAAERQSEPQNNQSGWRKWF